MRNLLLAIETSVGPFSIAIFEDNKLMDSYYHESPHCQAELLIPKISELLKYNDIGYSDITTTAVSIGPGSFTGIRIGIAAAQGISISTGCKIIGVSTLEAIAQEFDADRYAVALSAGREQFYCQWFRKLGNDITQCSEASLIKESEALSISDQNIIIRETHKSYPTLSAYKVGIAALSKKSDIHSITSPIYIRSADAKLPLKV